MRWWLGRRTGGGLGNTHPADLGGPWLSCPRGWPSASAGLGFFIVGEADLSLKVRYINWAGKPPGQGERWIITTTEVENPTAWPALCHDRLAVPVRPGMLRAVQSTQTPHGDPEEWSAPNHQAPGA